jgi:anti-sigma B factor antagonist
VTIKTTSRQVDGVTIVDLSGSITLDEGSAMLRKTVKGLAQRGSSKIVLNLGGVTSVDSAGVGELVSAYTSLRNAGGELKLLNLTREVHDLLHITKLCTVFDIEDDETSAIAPPSRTDRPLHPITG